MTSPISSTADIFETLCGRDRQSKFVARTYHMKLRRMQGTSRAQPLPEHTDTICAFIASENMHDSAVGDRAFPYLKALDRFGRKRETEFWRTVSEIDSLLEVASRDKVNKPTFNYQRLPTFDEACDTCSTNRHPCYKIHVERGKRCSKKCIPCFNHKRPCSASVVDNNDDDSDWSPGGRSLAEKIDTMNGERKTLAKPSPSSRGRPRTMTTPTQGPRAESSQMTRQRTLSQPKALPISPKHTQPSFKSKASCAPLGSSSLTPNKTSIANPKTPEKRSHDTANLGHPIGKVATQDPRKRARPSVDGPVADRAPETTSQPGRNLHRSQNFKCVPTPESGAIITTTNNLCKSTNGPANVLNKSPDLRPASLPTTVTEQRQSVVPSPPDGHLDVAGALTLRHSPSRSPAKPANSVHPSGSGAREASTIAPAPQRERFDTPVMDFQEAETGYLGLPARLEPVVDTGPSTPGVSASSILRFSPARARVGKPGEGSSSPRRAKRLSEPAPEEKPKRRKLGEQQLPKAVARQGIPTTSRRKSFPVTPTPFTPPQSRNTSPTAGFHAPSTQLSRSATPVPPPSSITPAASYPSQEDKPPDSTARMPTPVSPSRLNEFLPDFIRDDFINFRNHHTSRPQPEPTSDAAKPPATSSIGSPHIKSSPSPDPPAFTPSSDIHSAPITQDLQSRENASTSAQSVPGSLPVDTQTLGGSTSQLPVNVHATLPTAAQHPATSSPPRTSPSEQRISQLKVDIVAFPPIQLSVSTPNLAAASQPVRGPIASGVVAGTQYTQFVELVYQKAREIVEHHSNDAVAHLQLKFAIEDMRRRLDKIDVLKAKQGSDGSEKNLPRLKQMLLTAGKEVVSRMEEAQNAGEVDDVVLETMVEDLAGRLVEMDKPCPT